MINFLIVLSGEPLKVTCGSTTFRHPSALRKSERVQNKEDTNAYSAPENHEVCLRASKSLKLRHFLGKERTRRSKCGSSPRRLPSPPKRKARSTAASANEL